MPIEKLIHTNLLYSSTVLLRGYVYLWRTAGLPKIRNPVGQTTLTSGLQLQKPSPGIACYHHKRSYVVLWPQVSLCLLFRSCQQMSAVAGPNTESSRSFLNHCEFIALCFIRALWGEGTSRAKSNRKMHATARRHFPILTQSTEKKSTKWEWC